MTNVALLAPVPLIHLTDGALVCQQEGKVAFGSRAWEVFRDLDRTRVSESVDVLIYASHANADGPAVVTWRAKYIGHVEAKNGTHPEGMQYRPPSTAEHSSDNLGYWAVFWEVTDLHELPADEAIPVKELQSLAGKYFKASFVPEGPIIMSNPW